MKNWILTICFIISVVFSSCIKPNCCVLPQQVGIYGQKDSKPWMAKFITDTSQYSSTTLFAKTDSDMLKFTFERTSLALHVFEVPQNYEVTYYVTTSAHGKLTYVLDNTATNDIKVAYGTGEKANHLPNVWIDSNFNLTFKLATPTGNTTFDNQRINFSNGTIHYGLQN